MSENSIQAIDYIEKASYALLTTVGEENKPYVRYVGPVVNIGLDIYFMTAKDSRKIKHIQSNPYVTLYFQMHSQTVEEFKSVAVTGKASHVPIGEEFDDILTRLGKKSPGFKNWLVKDGLNKWTVYKVTAATLQYTDFAKSKKTIPEEI